MRITTAGVLLLAAWTHVANATPYEIRPDDERNLVKFQSKAPMESFEGKTRSVAGTITIDPQNPADGFRLEVRVELATLETGNALRNRHMRENHLETDRFPVATFRSETIVEGGDVALEPDTRRTILVEGILDLHGVPRSVQIPIDLTWADDELTVESRFPVTLADHDISRPGFLMMKLGETQTVVVDVVAVRMDAASVNSSGESTASGGTAQDQPN